MIIIDFSRGKHDFLFPVTGISDGFASHSLSQAKSGTHSPSPTGLHTRAYTVKQVVFRMGVVSLPSERSARSPTSPGRVSERQVLPLLGLGRGCSQRTQKAFGTAMRLCASLFRGVAAPLGCVILFLLSKLWLVCHALRVFPRVRGEGWYHYPRRALRAAETPDGRLSKRLTCRFLRSGEQRSLRSAYFFRIYRIFCRQFQLQTLLRYGIIIFPATCTCNLRFILKDRLLRNVYVFFCRVMI